MQQGGSRPTSQQPTDRPIIPRYLAEVGPVRDTEMHERRGEGRGREAPHARASKIRLVAFSQELPSMQKRARRRPITSQRPVLRSDACKKTKKEGGWMGGKGKRDDEGRWDG
ncbi:hypothetical protein H112_00550 [Trichophyton rubrum D6]|uniref:Uncharacterized protein n=1 Tax=Trichophyton rubrum CBS 288.86 TaxID=1215330 RepID=A0A022WFL8_TRIRU|nr:hypothetical protein H100_00549 [Trichophyton rubrum MR850]EZF46479.1 hypothetical protein H102_00549 [Trichophyton rubrum CBS 100081]EZF57137.1 hypothetical protein H103_00549 [Trichophyton rubrum CBS 288.86]EZF67706.1 hypothetical protein H104_00539 [Trichophyton rubrum CBS 289.86]EZF89076.1 hypothetical protein H110_00553 [Trichophyton rubrum MR1448]EZF99833.1 hypothetical protein H113_00554 [Trichophyton rubrum MR1459]EZG21480.1 hypothetical protein H107_00595 [Trichophyton rubrum CBS 